MPFYERGTVRIRYEEAGSGFPLLIIAGGGLNSTLTASSGSTSPFDPVAEFKSEYRCIAFDLRNANGGQSTGPLDVDRPWDSLRRRPSRPDGSSRHRQVHGAGLLHRRPVHLEPAEARAQSHRRRRTRAAQRFAPRDARPLLRKQHEGLGPGAAAKRPEVTMETVDKFLTKMYRTNPDFVFTVTRDFVRNCQTPVLILPDDVPPHPYAVAMEAAMLAPKAEVSMFPWKEPKERIPLAVRQIRSFLRAHRPA